MKILLVIEVIGLASRGPKRLERLAKDVSILNVLGEVVTVQIDLVNVSGERDLLQSEFNDSEKNGLYIDDMILQRIMDGQVLDYFYIFQKIIEITGDYDSIDSITALVRINLPEQPIEITVQLQGNNRTPQLLQVTDQTKYFNIINFVQTKWTLATRMS